MTEAQTISALAALAQTHRLRAFRALVIAGEQGLLPSHMAEQLAVAPSALSFHLKELSHAGLVSSEQRGRNHVYRANFETMNTLLSYLTEHCCEGEPCAVSPATACSTC